jgi:hypothetical protein
LKQALDSGVNGNPVNTIKTPMAPFEDPRDLAFQDRQWAFERLAGIVLVSLVVLAALGLFGSGPLDSQTVQTAKLNLEYGRFLRREAPNQMRLAVRPSAIDGFTLSFDRAYLERNRPESINPEPVAQVFKAGDLMLRFEASGPGPHVITLRLRPTQTGPLSGTLRLEPEQAIGLTQFVYP